MRRVFVILLLGALGCSTAWRPARPQQFARLHERITNLELRMAADDGRRSSHLRETVQQSREIDTIAAERFAFSNTTARLLAELQQELDTWNNTLDILVQGIDYVEKSVNFQKSKLAKSRRLFQVEYADQLEKLLSVLCSVKPDSLRCGNLPPGEATP